MADKLVINSSTKLSVLLTAYPWLKAELMKINDRFKLLDSPVGKVMVNKATIAEMSKRSGMDEGILIEKLQRLIFEKAGSSQ